MIGKLLARPHIRFMTDALLGFAVYCGLTVAMLEACSAGTASANTGSVVPLLSLQPNLAGSGPNDLQGIMLILALVFSALFALNLSFIRHLATAYRRAHRPSPATLLDQRR